MVCMGVFGFILRPTPGIHGAKPRS